MVLMEDEDREARLRSHPHHRPFALLAWAVGGISSARLQAQRSSCQHLLLFKKKC